MVAIENLPEEFVRRMSALLGHEAESFLKALTADRVRGVRANPAKIDPSLLGPLLGVALRPVPWSSAGFIVPEEVTLGGHPAHAAGLFYLQEPTAMSVAEALAPPPGARVLDLAAAPGGKTTHLASLVGPEGVVAAVEVDPARLGSLHESLDMWGAANVVTMRSSMEDAAGTGVEPFDAAVLDAPCSGEGLFRRDPRAARDWSPAMVRGCARRQQRMLARAADLIRPDGVLVYSTCTFEVAENEDQIAELLAAQPGWELEELFLPAASAGVPTGTAPTQRTARLWPHLVEGEGQFIARLRRTGRAPESAASRRRRPRTGPVKGAEAEVREGWLDFQRQYLPGLHTPKDRLLIRADRAFLLPSRSSGIEQSRLARPGLPLGRLRPGRFEPAPALATAVTPDQAAESLPWQFDDRRLLAYLRGEPVEDPGPDGWVLICCAQWPVAWSRRRGGVLKNLVPGHVRTRVTRAANTH